MASSGIYTFTTTRDEIIRQAALMVGAPAAGGTMMARTVMDFAHQLNAIVKRWEAKGIHLWTESEATLFPVPGQVRYSMGNGATDHVAETVYETTLSGSEALGQTTLSVTSIANMADNMIIGIMLDSGVLHWSAINGAPGGGTVTIDDALPSAAASGRKVYFYSSRIQRPLKIVDYRKHEISSALEIPVLLAARFDYFNMTDKASAGEMQMAYFESRRLAGNIYLYKVPSTVTHLLKFTWYKPLEIFGDADDNPDLPAEWTQALEYNLAVAMLPQYPGKKQNEINLMIGLAQKYEQDLAGWDREPEGIQIQVDHDGRG